MHGQTGEVIGPATLEGYVDKAVEVIFPGNKGNIDCSLTQLSRAPPPPLPGGYAVGEKVYFTGSSKTFASGVKLTHGHEGEVTGHPPSDNPHFGEGVNVKFPGHKNNTSCYLTELSRAKP